MPKSKKSTSRRFPRRGRLSARLPRRRLPSNVPEKASCSEVLAWQDGESNQIYGNIQLDLQDFHRAKLVAQAYQEYRITKLKWTFMPQFDTFAATTDATTALRVPNLYYMIDKTASLPPTISLPDMIGMGAKPRRFDDKNIIVSYSPGVSLAAGNTASAAFTAAAMTKTSPWLATNDLLNGAWRPSQTAHSGLFYILDAGGLPGDGQYEYTVKVEAQFEFRRPLMLPGTSNVPPAVVSVPKDQLVQH